MRVFNNKCKTNSNKWAKRRKILKVNENNSLKCNSKLRTNKLKKKRRSFMRRIRLWSRYNKPLWKEEWIRTYIETDMLNYTIRIRNFWKWMTSNISYLLFLRLVDLNLEDIWNIIFMWRIIWNNIRNSCKI